MVSWLQAPYIAEMLSKAEEILLTATEVHSEALVRVVRNP